MKKIIFSIIIVITLICCIFMGTEANSQITAKLTSSENNIEKGKEILITLGYDKFNGITDGINVYKAKLEYDEQIFEEVLEKDFKTLNNWTEFKYNKNTKEFIAIKKDGSKNTEDVIQINMKTKKETELKQTNVKITEIIASEGKKDINIDEVNFKLNIIEDEISKDDIQNTQKENETVKNEVVQNNQNNKLEKEEIKENKKEEEKENLFLGIFPNLGDSNFKKIILTSILILTIIAINFKNKYKKIDNKKTKISIIVFIIGLTIINHSTEIYANTNTNLKGNLNKDLKIDYEDINLLEEHLIHIKNLENDKINNADINEDKTISVTDLSLLVKYIEENKYFTETSDIDYTETLDVIENPERGFYTPVALYMKKDKNVDISPKEKLIHLRVGIGEFSGKMNAENKDIEFSENMITCLNETLENIKKKNGNVIIRFAYDNFEGIDDAEPSLDMILKHIAQLTPVFNTNKDVISYVELGFFGPWGEMHTSKICTTENVSKAIDEMLKATPKSMKIGVRTPEYYAAWKNINRNELDKDISGKDTDSYRIGIYNDGYLGSESDLGTFENREIEISWLEEQAKHTLYGGEVVANRAIGTALNTVEYISKEGFRTHTSYLNSKWNNTVLDNWKNEIYNGEDELYKGQNGYLYVENHLGYRFVLKQSKLTNKLYESGEFKTDLKVENVGFGNLVNDKKVTIVFEKDGIYYEIPTNIDPTTWDSKKITDINIKTTLPENIGIGEWKVYLRISRFGNLNNDNNYNCIRFANKDIWNQDIGANYIGKIEVLPKITNSEYRNTTSMYSWRNHALVKDADIIYQALNELKVQTLYQSINSSYMKKEYIEDIIKSYTTNGIEVHRLIGEPSWAYDNTSAKKKIDEINEYNKTVEESAKIKGVNLDIEPHVDERWDQSPQESFTKYKNTMIDLYNYAKQYNLHVTICTNVWFSKYEGFEELYEKAADTYSIMNYVKNTNISGIKEEIEIAEKYNKKIETIAHSSIDNPETESYHNDGMDKLLQDHENILDNYPYGNLRASYHHLTTIEYLKNKYVYLDLKLNMTDNSNMPTDLKLITPEGEEKVGYIVKLGKEEYYMFPRLLENVKYKVKSDSHEIIDSDTITIPSSPKGRTELEIKVKKKILRSSEQIGMGGCGCTNTPTISPFDSNTMIALTDMGGFFVSNNSGENWKRVDTKGVVNSVTFDPNQEGVIYVGGSGLYKSTDNGKNFEMIYPNKDKIIAEMNRFEDGKTFYYTKEGYETFKPIRNIAIDPKDSNHVFIAQYDFNDGVVLESKDGGKSFERLYEYSTKADDYVTKLFVEDDALIHMTIEEIYKYNFETKKETKIFTADVKIMDMVKVEDNFIILEQTETTYENYDKVKTKVRYTNNFVDFTDITKDIINGINDAIKDYENTTEDIYGVDYDNLNFKLNFKYLDATSLDNIYFTNVRCDQDLSDYQYYDCVLNYNKGKVNFIYGYPFKTSKSLVNPGSPFVDDIYDMFGVCVDKNDKDSVLFTTLGGIYYYNNGKLYQRNTILVEEKDGTKTYVNNGMNMHTTYSLKKDPLDPNHQLLLNTDLGLTHSYNGGKTWIRSHEGIKHEWINTIYDLEFDKEKEGIAYSVWSSRHDAPYFANEDETTNVYGGFAISYDSGNTWDSTYSSGLPEHINPVKISVVYNENSDERTIYLTSFNFGNYVSYDSGKNFTELNNGIPKVNNNKYIFGGDILAADGKVFMLTARTVYNNEEQRGKVYELINNTWKELELGENVRCPRALYYHNGELYISATAAYKYDWTIPVVEYKLVGGGIYKYNGKELKLISDETLSIGRVQIDSKGNLYASDIYGNVYLKNKEFDFYKIYSNYHFRSKGLTLHEEENINILYLATFGGGMLKLEVNK